MAIGDASDFYDLAARFESAAGRIGAPLSAAIRKTAFDIEADAKVLSPVASIETSGYVGGNLRNSISTTITGDGRTGSITAEIGPTAEYGGYVEDGTSRMAPQPYLRPAAERHIPRLETVLEKLGGELL